MYIDSMCILWYNITIADERRRYNMKWNAKKGLSNIAVLLIVIYVVCCYGEILVKNTHPEPQYSRYNIFTKLITN